MFFVIHLLTTQPPSNKWPTVRVTKMTDNTNIASSPLKQRWGTVHSQKRAVVFTVWTTSNITGCCLGTEAVTINQLSSVDLYDVKDKLVEFLLWSGVVWKWSLCHRLDCYGTSSPASDSVGMSGLVYTGWSGAISTRASLPQSWNCGISILSYGCDLVVRKGILCHVRLHVVLETGKRWNVPQSKSALNIMPLLRKRGRKAITRPELLKIKFNELTVREPVLIALAQEEAGQWWQAETDKKPCLSCQLIMVSQTEGAGR